MEQAQERKNLSLRHISVTASAQAQRGDVPAPEPETFASSRCQAVTPVLNRVGDKWSMQVVMALSFGSKRFSQLKREIDGISQRMLTLTLRGLERDGMISRHVTPSIPPRVDYELTELGVSLKEPVRALGAWAAEHIECIRAAQGRYDAAQDAEA